MKLIKLSDDDVTKMMALAGDEMQVQTRLGALRKEYLAQEAECARQLTNLHNERMTLLNALGRHYLKNQGPNSEFRFLPDQMAFVVGDTSSEETEEDNGNLD